MALAEWLKTILFGLEANKEVAVTSAVATKKMSVPYSKMISGNAQIITKHFSKAKEFYDETEISPDLKYGGITLKEEFKNIIIADLAKLNLALFSIGVDWYDPAEKLLKPLSIKYPSNITINLALADVRLSMMSLEKRNAEVMGIYNTLISKHPNTISSRKRLADIAEHEGRIGESLTLWEEIKTIAPEWASVYLFLGKLYEQSGRMDDATQSYLEVIKRIPKLPLGYNQLAWIYSNDPGKIDIALSYAKKAKALAEKDPVIADTL